MTNLCIKDTTRAYEVWDFDPVYGALGAASVTAVLYTVAPQSISVVQLVLAFGLLAIPWCSYFGWKQVGAVAFPMFSVIAFMHWVYFALPLFIGRRLMPVTGMPIAESTLDQVMVTVFIGVITLWVGMNTGLRQHVFNSPANITVINSRLYLYAICVGGVALGVFVGPYAFGEGGRQLLTILERTIPNFVFSLLARDWFAGRASHSDKLVVVTYAAAQSVVALSSGWLGSVVFVPAILAMVYVMERKRLPLVPILTLILLVLFLQVGKGDYRTTYWYGAGSARSLDRVVFWLRASSEKWYRFATERDSSILRELSSQSVERLSLLEQTANVIEKTPDEVPYQFGRTYSYMAVTLVPRFLWPEKPSITEANRFYQVAYGLTDPANLDSVSIAVGVLAEGYINFGLFGVIGVMYIMGVLLGIVQNMCFPPYPQVCFGALGLALVPQLMSIESQFSLYFGGLIQEIAVTLMVMAPLILARSPLRLEVGESLMRQDDSGAAV